VGNIEVTGPTRRCIDRFACPVCRRFTFA